MLLNTCICITVVMTIITMMLYYIDKRKAIKNKWRIKERTLLLCSFFFGSIGGLIGLYGFRHKTKHWYFILVNWVSFVILISLFAYLIIYKK